MGIRDRTLDSLTSCTLFLRCISKCLQNLVLLLLLIGPLGLMLADGQDLAGSYIRQHLSLVNAQLREAVYIHIHMIMDALLPHSIPRGHRYCVSISTIYDIILFGFTH